jgi:signal transduction histidine kinase/DNA-binding response OmpR family regulator/sugar lactone lactonase YvrE
VDTGRQNASGAPLRTRRRPPVLALLLILLGSSLWLPRTHANDRWIIRPFGLAQGMPVSSATSAQQDRDGFLWFATHDGLARFDGRHFSVFDAERVVDMGSNRVVRLYKGARGTVYGHGALGAWLEVDAGRVRRVVLDPAHPQAKVSFVAPVQPELPDEATLCLTLTTGVYCEADPALSPSGFVRRRTFEPGLPVIAALPYAGNDWLVVAGRGVYLARGPHQRLLWPDASLTMTGALLHAKVGHDGALIIPVRGGVRRVFPDGRNDWVVADPQLDVVQLQVEANGDVEISTSHESYRIDLQGRRTQIHPEESREAVLRRWPEPVSATRPAPAEWFSRGGELYQDRRLVLRARGDVEDVLFTESGIVWVSTSRDGIYALSPARLDPLPAGALAESNAYGTVMAADGSVWIGSLGDGVFRVAAYDRVERFGEEHGLPGPNLWGVGVTPDEDILVFPLRGGAWKFQPETRRFVRLELPPDLNQARLRSLSVDAQGRLWLAGSEGAWRREPSATGDGDWQKRWPAAAPGDGSKSNVQSVLHDADGRTWFATDQGLYWQQDEQSQRIEGLEGVAIRGLLRAHDGALWVATEGRGLQRFAPDDLQGLAPLQIGRTRGAPSNSPHSMIQDAEQQLWVNSNQGIYRLTTAEIDALLDGRAQTVSPLTLGLADGLRDLEGNGGLQPAAALDRNGRIWFPTQRGIVRFSPRQLGATRVPGRVIVETLTSGRRVLDLSDATSPNHRLQLPQGARDINLRFNAAELSTGQVRFRYRLQGPGRSEEWIDGQSAESASFEMLAPGFYRFEVQAGNADGIWRSDAAILNFEVPAYLHETRAFRWSSVVLILLLGGFVVRWRYRQLVARAGQLETLVLQRTEELARTKANVEHALRELALSHAALSESHLGIESRNQRLAEQATRLEALDRFRTRLLADVSHELRSPLMLVNLPLQSLSERELAEADRRLIALARQNAGRLSHLIEQLVHLVQAEAQQIQLHFRRMDLLALAQRVVDGFTPLLRARHIHVAVCSRSGPELPQIFADAEQLTTVISNLLDNASKFAPEGSEIRVELQLLTDSQHLRLSVQDAGPGFPPELSDRLFERFFRAEGPPRAGREGLGVGLALAQELIYLHGGSIHAANRSDTRGACFWFDLPLGAAHLSIDDIALQPDPACGAWAPPGPPAAADIVTGRLLLVEDHPDLAAYLAEQLAEHCSVIVAADAENAWGCLQEHAIDCIVSDVVLPGADGVAFCAQVKSDLRYAEIPVLLISAKAGKSDRSSGLAAGAAAWLTKPFSIETLLQVVSHAWPRFSTRSLAAVAGETRQAIAEESGAAADLQQGQGSTRPAELRSASGVDRLLQLAQRRLGDPEFGIPQWAEQAHLSERQLRRRVTELTGMAPVAWLREQRLYRVHELVSTAACRTLAEAGLKAGIHNAAYLYRLYRARFGDRDAAAVAERDPVEAG